MAVNPYQAPRASVKDHDGDVEYQNVKLFSVSGRIGRVRYIAYTIGVGFVAGLVAMIGAGLSAVVAPLGVAVMAAAYIAMLVLHIMLTIQRSHDFNVTGWISPLVFVPLAVFAFWLLPGTEGENRWGPQTPPNRRGAMVVVFIPIMIALIGILAAIAIPQYQAYVQRAQQVQQP